MNPRGRRTASESEYADTDSEAAQAVAEYIAELAGQLETMALHARLDMLGYLLAMTREEAESVTGKNIERIPAGSFPNTMAQTKSEVGVAILAPQISKYPLPGLIDAGEEIELSVVANSFGMSETELAETAGFVPGSVHQLGDARADNPQSRIREMLEVVARVADWAGGRRQAMAWYRAEPIPAFGARTAESLVKSGQAGALRDYLDHLALGGFA